MRAGPLSLLALCFPAMVVAAQPPITAFTDFPKFESMKISPNGTYLAFTRHSTEHELMMVLHFQGLKVSTQTHFGDLTDIASFVWANDSRLLISPSRRFPGFTAYRAPTGEIIGLDADGKGAELLFGFAAGMQAGTRIEQRQSTFAAAWVIDRLPANPGEVLIQTYGYGIEGELNSVYRMNVTDGKLKKVAGSPIRNGTFQTDFEHRVALVSGEDKEGNSQVLYRAADSGNWKLLANSAMGEGLLRPVAASGQQRVVLRPRRPGRFDAWRVRLDAGDRRATPAVSAPGRQLRPKRIGSERQALGLLVRRSLPRLLVSGTGASACPASPMAIHQVS